jgi:apolipoprotein D and lipocalin family protein
MKKYYKIISLMLLAWILNGCKAPKDLPTVPEVDINKYAGKWFEIASFPSTFQKHCKCTFAEYTITDKGYLKVYNQCIDKRNGKIIDITGKAFPVEGSNNSKLKVQFFALFKAPYYIIDLDENYDYALVGSPDRDYLWILCRTTSMSDETYQKLCNKAQSLGFDVSKLKKAVHDC